MFGRNFTHKKLHQTTFYTNYSTPEKQNKIYQSQNTYFHQTMAITWN